MMGNVSTFDVLCVVYAIGFLSAWGIYIAVDVLGGHDSFSATGIGFLVAIIWPLAALGLAVLTVVRSFASHPVESVKINEYVNRQLREIMDVRENVVRKAAVEILRAKGYTVIEPPKPSGHVHEKWQLQDSAKGGKYCAACGEDVKGDTNND